MGDSFLDMFTPQEIDDAKNGDRRAAINLLKIARDKMASNVPLPTALRDYFVAAIDDIINGKQGDYALNLKRSKKGKRQDMAYINMETLVQISVAYDVYNLTKQGFSQEKAITAVAENRGFDFSQTKTTYKKWREGIEITEHTNAVNSSR